eukprot:891223-Karenia_brevis.AAC.1
MSNLYMRPSSSVAHSCCVLTIIIAVRIRELIQQSLWITWDYSRSRSGPLSTTALGLGSYSAVLFGDCLKLRRQVSAQ